MATTRDFIAELEKQLELERPMRSDADGIWMLAIDEELIVTIADLPPGYSFHCNVGECPTKNAEDFLTKAMGANLFGQGTFDGILGLNNEGNTLTLAFERETKADYKKFQEDFEDFLNAADYWHEETKK